MADARHYCPDCGSIDLDITDGIVAAKTVKCPNCGWAGGIGQTIGFATTEQVWDIERVGNVLLRTMAVNAAGPLVQALEFIGLLPRKRFRAEQKSTRQEDLERYQKEDLLFDDPSTPKWNAEAQRARDRVMAKICEAAVTAAFEEAEKQNRRFAIEMDTGIHPMLEEVEETKGNVVPLKHGKKNKRRR